jgi:hypothetical protein
MQNCVHRGFPHRHGDLHDLLVVKAGLGAMRLAVSSALFTVSNVESSV